MVKQLLTVKTDEEYEKLQNAMKRTQSSFDHENKHPNVLTYNEESPARVDRNTILIRQFVCFNLTEKMDALPLIMRPIEKKWLIFQLLCGLQ